MNCVPRFTKIGIVAALVVFGISATIWIWSRGSDRELGSVSDGSARMIEVHDPDLGLTVSIPRSWQFARAGVPGGGFSASNGPVTWSEELPCTQVDRTHVDLSITSIKDSGTSVPPKPTRPFTENDGSGLKVDPRLPCGALSQRIDFAVGGSQWSSHIRFGPDATAADRRNAYTILTTMRSS